MIPVVTPQEMGAVDRAATEPVDVLIGRAGGAVARVAIEMLGGAYGRRVVVVEGRGHNGDDGREAARRLRARGVRVVEIDAETAQTMGQAGISLPAADLVIDAAYGTGFRGTWSAPDPTPGTTVLAVDIPSGVDGLTGAVGAGSRVLPADRTVTFAALKPGLVLGAGRRLAGEVTVADIGLDVSGARAHVLPLDGALAAIGTRAVDAHKWQAAVWVVAGSPGMAGAAALVCGGAQRAGAGYVRVSTPGGLGAATGAVPIEAVHVDLPLSDWASVVAEGLDRFRSLVIGNGLGADPATTAQVREVLAAAGAADVVTVLDADGLRALSPLDPAARGVVPRTIVTPHDGEFARLMGAPPGADRLAAARQLSARTGGIALLKGATTVVAAPDGQVLLSLTGDARLATAGTGDVLAGIIGGLAARRLDPFVAAAVGAVIHGAAGALGWSEGLVAGDVIALLPTVLDDRTARYPSGPS